MSNNDDLDFSHSFTDLMTSLAIAFLILAVGMIVINIISQRDLVEKVTQLEIENKEIREYKNDLAQRIAEILKMNKVKDLDFYTSECVELDLAEQYRLVIRFKGNTPECKTEGLFFRENKFTFEGTPVAIGRIAEIYKPLCEESVKEIDSKKVRNFVERVQILGHTDKIRKNTGAECKDLPDDDNLQCGNLYLSAQRARTVFLQLGQSLTNMKSYFKCFSEKTQISGRGPFDPRPNLSDKSESEGLNRRVEIVIDLRVPRVVEKKSGS